MSTLGGEDGLGLVGFSSGLLEDAHPSLYAKGACRDTCRPLRDRVLMRLRYVYNLVWRDVLTWEQLCYILNVLCTIPGVPA